MSKKPEEKENDFTVGVSFGDTVIESKDTLLKETEEAVHAFGNFLKEAWQAIKAFFKAIGNFFKRLFSKKPADEKPAEEEKPVEEKPTETK